MITQRSLSIFILILVAGCVFVLGDVVSAQVTVEELGGGGFEASGLASGGSLTLIIARIIRGFIALLGIVAVGFIVYGGWLWMMAGGDEANVEAAKKVIINGTIGMAIVLSSFAIASFVINALVTGVTGQSGGGGGGSGGSGGGGGPFGGGSEVTVRFPANTKAGFIDQFTFYFFKDFGKPAVIDVASITKGNTLTVYRVTPQGEQVMDVDVEVQANTLLLSVKKSDAFACPQNSKKLTHCFPNDGTFKAVFKGGGAIGSGIYDTQGDPLVCTNSFPCSGTWRIGHVDDVTAPTGAIISLTDLKGGAYYTSAVVPVDSTFTGKGDAIDDLEVKDISLFEDGVLYMSIPFQAGADGFYPSSALFSFPYDTQGFGLLSSHEINLDVRDSSNNEGQGSALKYKVAAAHCFNKVQDADEQGVNCGGAACPVCSSSQCKVPPDQCNTSCTKDGDCDSGVCGENKQCVISPIITGVFFNNGAPGNYVQIVGKGFGVHGANSRVSFSKGNAQELLDIATCPGSGPSWTDTQIIFRVPDTKAGDYVITVRAQSGLSDSTNNDILPLLPDFKVNTVVRPGIACVKPNGFSAPLLVGSSITVHGTNFGASQDQGSKVTVGSVAVAPKPSNSWSNTSVQTVVPSVTQGMQSVVIERAGIDSNPYNILVGAVDENTLPVIGSVFPSTASPGDMITIVGTGFGTQKSSVFFGDNLVLADTNFPAQCATASWSSSQIVVKIPKNLPIGKQSIVVERLGPVVKSQPYPYVVEAGASNPNLCALQPNNGPVGTTVSLYGEQFGSSGSVAFSGAAAPADGIAWSTGFIAGARVPTSALSGDVKVVNAQGQSNPLQFTINNCLEKGCLEANQICCTAGTAAGACVSTGSKCPGVSDTLTAAYEWTFATGKVPQIPYLLNQCGANLIPSPSPSAQRNGGDTACVNSIIAGQFSVGVKRLKYGSDIVVERCIPSGDGVIGSCSKSEIVPITFFLSPGVFSSVSRFSLVPVTGFQAATTYRVTLSNSIMSNPTGSDPIHMLADQSCAPVAGLAGQPSACFTFTTRQSAEPCKVESVMVQPTTHTTDAFGLIMTKEGNEDVPLEWSGHGFGADQCVLLRTTLEKWSWATAGSNMSAASVQSLGGTLADRAHVTAINGLPSSERVQIAATYTNPDGGKVSGSGQLSIVEESPRVVSAQPQCNVACNQAPISVTFNAPMVKNSGVLGIQLYRCYDESCKTLAERINGYFLTTPDTVITKANGEKVTTKTVFTLQPYASLLSATWYKVVVKGGPTGVKNVSGLTLTGGNEGQNYTWKFRTRNANEPCQVHSVEVAPIKGVTKAGGETVTYTATPKSASDACSSTGQPLAAWDYNWQWSTDSMTVASVVGGGVDIGQTQPWCSSDGFKSGSVAYPAVCGDGKLSSDYEECDDGNTEKGDDCSERCLLNGVVSFLDSDGDGAADGGTCGNAVPADPTYKSANNNPGIQGLEECDDGNAQGGDGCSVVCLNEGSTSGGSVCGNGDVGPGEDCDDGNIYSGDGCSSICLHEGSPRYNAQCATLTPYSAVALKKACEGDVIWASCGNNIIEFGEACDGGNAVDGDGCSSNCLVEFGEAGPPKNDADNKNLCTPTIETDGLKDPVQKVVAIGLGAVNDKNEQLTKVKATAIQTGASSVTGSADFALQCGYVYGSNCAQYMGKEDSAYGVAHNSCCLMRPHIVAQMPQGTNACLNSHVYVDLDQEVDDASLTDHVRLYDSDCSAGEASIQVALLIDGDDARWYARVWTAVKRVSLAVVRPFVFAQDGVVPKTVVAFCPSDVDGKVHSEKLETGGSRIFYTITKLLKPSTKYLLVLDGGSNGVKTSSGLTFYDQKEWFGSWFTTSSKNTACELASVSLNPSSVTLGDIDTQKSVFVQAFTGDGALLAPIPGLYNWTYAWELAGQNPENSVIMTGTGSTSKLVKANQKIGSAVVNVEASITENVVGSTGETFSDSASIDVFVCENKWPKSSFGFSDYKGKTIINSQVDIAYATEFGIDFSLGSIRTNFSTKYCRDRGVVGNTSDDLPGLKPLVITAPPNPQTTLKEFFFQPDVQGNKDVIGLRIEKNPGHLPLGDWYISRGFAGKPTPTNVAGYPALQDGRTLYISGVNASVTSDNEHVTDLRTNVYVFSYNQGAVADTLAIFQQLINNFQLLVNVYDPGNVCYFDADTEGFVYQPERDERFVNGGNGVVSCVSDADCASISPPDDVTIRCANVKRKIARDLRRIHGLQDIADGLKKFNDNIKAYPVLSTGTFVPGRSVSTWNSWQSLLGNNLGFALPVDPINVMHCADDQAEVKTCWNQTTQQYACDAGTFAYEYVVKQGGQSYELRSQFELPISLWKDVAINEPKWRTADVCDGTVIGAAEVSVCGNNVVEGSEQCDPSGITKKEKQNPVNGTVETITYSCTNACVWQIQGSVTTAACGNGEINVGELCDDGDKNGDYGFCKKDCQAAATCGDGIVQSVPVGPEVCDVGIAKCSFNAAKMCTKDAECTIRVDGRALTNDEQHQVANCSVTLNQAAGEWIGYDFQCGTCGKDRFCVLPGKSKSTVSCLSNADCSFYKDLPPKTSETVISYLRSYCTWTEKKSVEAHEYSCGTCSSETTYALNKVNSCNWDCRQFGPYCGDGIVQAPFETCDGKAGLPASYVDPSCSDGQVFQPACSNTCKVSGGSCVTPLAVAGTEPVLPSCGDAKIDAGEECDAGAQNAYSCIASYANPAQTCTFCHKDSCRIKAQTGGFCGDEVLNGSEVCDKNQIKGGAAEACLALGFDYGIPQCNLQCSAYAQEGCAYCGIVDGTGTYDVQGVFIAPGHIDPLDRIVDSGWTAAISHEGAVPKNGSGSGEKPINVFGSYGFYLDQTKLPSGDLACTQYKVILQNGPDASFETPVFSGDGQDRVFKHFLSSSSMYPLTTFLFVVEWPKQFENLDLDFYGTWDGMKPGDQIVRVSKQYPLTSASTAFKKTYTENPWYCLGVAGSKPGGVGAPISCAREDGVYVSYLYDTTSSNVGYEAIAITNPIVDDDSILFRNKPSAYVINVIDVNKKGLMDDYVSDIKLHLFTDGGKHYVFDKPTDVTPNKIRFDVHSIDSVNFTVKP